MVRLHTFRVPLNPKKERIAVQVAILYGFNQPFVGARYCNYSLTNASDALMVV